MIELIIFLFISSISLFLFEDNQNQQKPIKQLTYKIIKPTNYYALSFGGGGQNFWDATHRITSQLKQAFEKKKKRTFSFVQNKTDGVLETRKARYSDSK
jgi:predicted esterase YcpF (UPF0227 family)